jgi:hypothetical protein
MTPGAGAAAIAAAVLDPDEARFLGDEIVVAAAAAASASASDADATPPTLAQLAARFRCAFPPGHARFCACSAAALVLEATRRAPPRSGGGLEPGQRAALWFCVRAAFLPCDEEEEDGGGNDSSSLALALNPFLPLMLRAVSSLSSASSSSSALPERAYLLRMLAAPPRDDAAPTTARPALYAALPPSAAVARIEAESAASGDIVVEVEALCERWRQAATKAARRRGRRRPEPPLASVPWQRPEPRPLPPLPGELRWLYPPLPVEVPVDEQQQPGAPPPPLFLWDGATGAEDEDEGEDDGAQPPQQQQQPPKRSTPPPLTVHEARDLLGRALRGPLPPSQQQRLLAALETDARRRQRGTTTTKPPLVVRLGIEAEHMPLLVENVPNLAHGLLAAAQQRTTSARGRELLTVLAAAAPVSVSSLEVVHRLASVAMPRPLLRMYVARCLATCEQLLAGEAGGGLGSSAAASLSSSSSSLDSAASRLVRLVCVFLTALVKSGALWVGDAEEDEGEDWEQGGELLLVQRPPPSLPGPSSAAPPPPPDDGDPLLHQLRAWCVSMSRVREAAALFQMLQAQGG